MISNAPIDVGTYCIQTLAQMATPDAPFIIKSLADGYVSIAVGEVSWVLPFVDVEALLSATIGIQAHTRAKKLAKGEY